MKSSIFSPIALFTYNRPWHTRQTVEALQKNELVAQSELIIFSDAPKNSQDKESVQQVRAYLKTITGFNSVTIIERTENYGLAKSIITGVTEIVKKYGKIIVLEDDLVTSPYFLTFMNEALSLYKEDNQVSHISGYNYPINQENLGETFFVKPTTCWSWATWDRAWVDYVKDANFYVQMFDKDMIKDFNLNNAYDYFAQIRLNAEGKLNTWAIFWYATNYLKDRLSLHPRESYAQNIGHDSSGENCGVNNDFNVNLVQTYQPLKKISIEQSKLGRKAFEDYFNSIKPTIPKRMINKGFETIKKPRTILKRLKKHLVTANWHNLRNLEPISREFGFDRGTPIDRIYIETFLQQNVQDIQGVVCEIADNGYSKQFGTNVTKYEILHYSQDNAQATIIGDLTDINTLPAQAIDCFILTQTLNFIENIDLAIQGIVHMLKPNGIALITVAGLCQISRYDMDRWGDYWRFTDLSLKKSLAQHFDSDNIQISTFGNVLTATALLQGLSAEELTYDELRYHDKDYQIIITARVKKV